MEDQLRALENQLYSRPAETAEAVADLLAQAKALGDQVGETYATCLLAGSAFFQGNYAAALRYSEQSRQLAHEYGLRALEARSFNALGLSYWRMGKLPEALENFHQSLVLVGRIGDEVGRTRILNNLGRIYVELNEYDRGYQNFLEAAALAELHQRAEYLVDALTGKIEVLYRLKRLEEALALVPTIRELAGKNQLVRAVSTVSRLEALLLHDLGRYDEGLIRGHEGLVHAEQIGDLDSQAFNHWVLASLYLATGNLARAQEHLKQSEKRADEMDRLQLRSEVKHLQSKLLRELGDWQGAFEALDECLERRTLLHERSRQLQSQAISRQIQLELLGREAQAERQRNTALKLANAQLQDTQTRLTYQASHDILTGLLNRAAFWQKAEQKLQNRRTDEYAGILFADIDHLKIVNDTYGHAAGDQLIQEIARRFKAQLSTADLIGRLSGDELMVYLTNLGHPDDVDTMAQQLMRSLSRPFTIEGAVLQPSVSLGSVVAPRDGVNLTELHHHADLALYQAKQQGKGMWVRFEPEFSASERRRRQLKEGLKIAAEQGNFELHYQPQFALPGLEFIGVEALLRWQHPQLGWISPAEFVPLAEESGLIVSIGDWVLREACRQARAWEFQQHGLVMSANVSVRQFERRDFVASMARALEVSDLPGECLVLELTETVIYKDAKAGAKTVEELHALGLRIAIDDFGTGYSSLRLLKELPFRHLKVDRSFVSDLTAADATETAARHFMEMIVNLAQGLEMRVVAEGVETQEQLDLLCEIGCHKAQGYLLARPMNAQGIFQQFLTPLAENPSAETSGHQRSPSA